MKHLRYQHAAFRRPNAGHQRRARAFEDNKIAGRVRWMPLLDGATGKRYSRSRYSSKAKA